MLLTVPNYIQRVAKMFEHIWSTSSELNRSRSSMEVTNVTKYGCMEVACTVIF